LRTFPLFRLFLMSYGLSTVLYFIIKYLICQQSVIGNLKNALKNLIFIALKVKI
jgi:hypothetical protein